MLFPVHLLLTLAIPVGLAFLQVFLSRRESRWPGLALPVVSLILSVVVGVGNVAFSTVTTTQDGVRTAVHNPGAPFAALAVFLIMNIPTVVYLAIYFSCRENARRKREMARMNAQDL